MALQPSDCYLLPWGETPTDALDLAELRRVAGVAEYRDWSPEVIARYGMEGVKPPDTRWIPKGWSESWDLRYAGIPYIDRLVAALSLPVNMVGITTLTGGGGLGVHTDKAPNLQIPLESDGTHCFLSWYTDYGTEAAHVLPIRAGVPMLVNTRQLHSVRSTWDRPRVSLILWFTYQTTWEEVQDKAARLLSRDL